MGDRGVSELGRLYAIVGPISGIPRFASNALSRNTFERGLERDGEDISSLRIISDGKFPPRWIPLSPLIIPAVFGESAFSESL